MKRVIGAVAVFALALTLASSAKADILHPGDTGGPDSLAQGGFTFLATTGILTWTSSTGLSTGTAVSEVDSDLGNVYCAGCLDFLYAVGVDSTSTDSIDRITASLFAGFMTDVGITPSRACFSSQGTFPGNSPSSVDRSGGAGSTIGWNWPTSAALDPGYCGPVLIIETNAHYYTTGYLSMIDTGVATVTSFAPTAVPEPATLTLLGTGLLSLGGLLRRKKK